MRCLIVTPNDPGAVIGGVERFVQMLVDRLSQRGVSFDIIHLGSTRFKPAWYDRYWIGGPRQGLHTSKAASAALRRSHYDLVLVNGIAGWALHSPPPIINVHHGTFRGGAVAMARIASGVNIARRMKRKVTTALTYWVSGTIEALVARAATVNVAVSASVRDELVNLYGLDGSSIRVIQNGVDINHFHPIDRNVARSSLGISKDKFVILFSGRDHPGKRIDLLVQLACFLQNSKSKDSDSDIEFIAAVDRPIQSSYIRTIEKVTYSDLPMLYSAADVFVLPSIYEGCSISVIEAMACGLPTVMTDVGHARDIKEHSSILAPYIVPVDSPPELFADLILSIKRDAAKRQTISVEARRYVLEHNSMQAMAESYLNLFHEILDSEGNVNNY